MRLKEKTEEREFMTRKLIRLTESDLHSIISESVQRLLREYDEHLLDGVDSIDVATINMHIKQMIPLGGRVSKNSPYKPIRQLVLYFSEDGAMKHGGRLTKDIVNNILKNEKVRKAVYDLSLRDRKIKGYIYGPNKLSGRPLMQRVVWEMDGILESLMNLNQEYKKTNSAEWFGHTDALMGGYDNRIVGLSGILRSALANATKIKEQIKKMQELLDRPRDPFSYSTRSFGR